MLKYEPLVKKANYITEISTTTDYTKFEGRSLISGYIEAKPVSSSGWSKYLLGISAKNSLTNSGDSKFTSSSTSAIDYLKLNFTWRKVGDYYGVSGASLYFYNNTSVLSPEDYEFRGKIVITYILNNQIYSITRDISGVKVSRDYIISFGCSVPSGATILEIQCQPIEE